MGRKRQWWKLPESKRREVIRLAAGGVSGRAIAEELRVGAGAVARVLKPLGGVVRPEMWLVPDGCMSIDDRVEIRLGLERGESMVQIAGRLGRHRSTVWREVSANGGAQRYAPMAAHRRACERFRRPKPTKLEANPALCAEVVAGLEKLWSPEQISARLREDHPEDPEMWVSHETIYKSLFVQGRGELRRELAACLRTGRTTRKRRGRLEQRGRIRDMVSISDRPGEVDDRAVPGHWEGDLIIGAKGNSAIGTLVERSTRFVLLLHLPKGRDAVAVRDAMTAVISTLPQTLMRSITWDQGKEMSEHARFSLDTGVAVYFCDPHSPWQRGQIENQNRAWRYWFPRGTRLDNLDQTHVDEVAAIINGQRRRNLGYQRPTDLYAAATVH